MQLEAWLARLSSNREQGHGVGLDPIGVASYAPPTAGWHETTYLVVTRVFTKGALCCFVMLINKLANKSKDPSKVFKLQAH